MASIAPLLAHALGRRDEQPNIDLAEKIARRTDISAVKELVSLLFGTAREIRHDAIKVLYETGMRKPELLFPYTAIFLDILDGTDNRMKWGAMCALSAISLGQPQLMVPHLVRIVDAMDNGTVITRDHGIYILAQVTTLKKYHVAGMELLLEQIGKAPVNQVPMYAEKMADVISPPYVGRLIRTLRSRQDVLEIPSKEKRIAALIRKLKT